MVDNLYEYEEAINLNDKAKDLDLSKVNVYLHQILNLIGYRVFKIKIFYGNIAEDGSF